MSTNAFDYTASARRVVNTEKDVLVRERDYAALVRHFNLTVESESATVTDAARKVTIDGYAALNMTVTEDMLTGRDPGADAAHRTAWKLARAVRIGLVKAMAPADEEETVKPVVLRVSLSGEGGGSIVVDPSDNAELYARLVTMIQGL